MKGVMTIKQKVDSKAVTSTGSSVAETGWPIRGNRECLPELTVETDPSAQMSLGRGNADKTSPWNCQKQLAAETKCDSCDLDGSRSHCESLYSMCNCGPPPSRLKTKTSAALTEKADFSPEVLNATCWMRASLGRGLVSCCDDMCHVPVMGVKLGLIQTRLCLRKLFFIMAPLKVTGDDWGRANSMYCLSLSSAVDTRHCLKSEVSC